MLKYKLLILIFITMITTSQMVRGNAMPCITSNYYQQSTMQIQEVENLDWECPFTYSPQGRLL